MTTSTTKKAMSIAIAGHFTTPTRWMAFVSAAALRWTPMMTDSELLVYLGLPEGPDECAYVANLSLSSRLTFERMKECEEDIKLW